MSATDLLTILIVFLALVWLADLVYTTIREPRTVEQWPVTDPAPDRHTQGTESER